MSSEQKIEQLNANLFRFSAFEKKFLVDLKWKKKERLTASQERLLEDLYERLQKQLKWKSGVA